MRKTSVERNTKETKIACNINIDGTGKSNINTGIGFFDHMLEIFSHHSLIDIELSVDGDTPIPLKGTKKSIISFFDSNSSEVKAFIKSNKLKVNDINSLIKIFEFAEKL